MKINVVDDFSKRLVGRYLKDGNFTGESFRELIESYLLFDDSSTLTIDFDGVSMVGSSFLEESFGGLVRNGWDKDVLMSRLNIVNLHNDSRIQQFINDASPEVD